MDRRAFCPLAAALGVAAALSAGPELLAQVSRNGPELQVNSYTTSHQVSPAVDSDPLGRFFVVWSGMGSSGTDTSSWSVQGRRFERGGIPLGDDFQVNTETLGFQHDPDVAVLVDGSFVVVWTSDTSSGTDLDGYSIQGRRFDPSGQPLGVDFQVNSYTPGDQSDASVAALGSAGFVVAWQSAGSAGSDQSGFSIQARRFDLDGVPRTEDRQANDFTIAGQERPAVAGSPRGDFVISWQSELSIGTDTDGLSIQARRFDADGLPLGPEVQVNTYTTSGQYRADVALDDRGHFVVVWTSDGSGGTDVDHNSIQAQLFESQGLPVGGEFQVNAYTTSYQDYAAIASDPAGGFVVSWSSVGSVGTDPGGSVQARRYRPSGASAGAQFQVNTYTTGSQSDSAISTDQSGNFVLVWGSSDSPGSDTDGWSIQAQRFDALFRDGFESGDTSRWSDSAP